MAGASSCPTNSPIRTVRFWPSAWLAGMSLESRPPWTCGARLDDFIYLSILLLTDSVPPAILTRVNPTFRDRRLDRLEADEAFDGGYQPALVKAFRRRMQQIRAAMDERDFYSQKSLRFEKLKGERAHQHSMRLNDQWRLILEFEGRGAEKVVVIVEIEDYH